MRWIVLLGAGLGLLGCSDENVPNKDGGPKDTQLSDGPKPRDSAPPTDAIVSKEGTPDHSSSCEPPMPPSSQHIDTCLLSHRPQDKAHLSAQKPAATEPITLRIETQAGDAQKVMLRAWTGVERWVIMTLETTANNRDMYVATLPASARPIYYRFRLEDDGAVLFLTKSGPTATPPVGVDDFYIAPVAGPKTLHYKTDFVQPVIRVRQGNSSSYSDTAMISEGATLAGVTGVGSAHQEMFFYIRDAMPPNNEDHPPGGGDYRMPPAWEEAWLDKGTLFDVDPSTVSVDLLDAHTHPYNRVNGDIVVDSQPLTTLLPAQGISLAITMLGGSLDYQRTEMTALHKANRWIIPLVWINPHSHEVAGVEELIKNCGFRGLKFHPTIDNFPADSAVMDKFMALAEKYRVPVQIHSATDDNASPDRIVALAKRFPNVPVIMVHTQLGAVDKTYALNLIKTTTNVYSETSWSSPQSILQAMNVLDSSRTLFGTDATIDGYEHFTNKSIPNSQGQYVYSYMDVLAEMKSSADPAAYENWSHLTVFRLYHWSLRPDPDLYDTDGDGSPDISDPDDDNDGKPNDSDPAPLNPGQ